MNKRSKIYIALAINSCALFLSSCDLDLVPLNDVTLEKYWTEKEDVQSFLNGCYSGMQQDKYITQSIVWGECRSDNVIEGVNVNKCNGLLHLLKGQLKPTNPLCDWAAIYKVINQCNTLLKYAPTVAEKDPNYTESDLRISCAEARALRAMSYFLLVKTFKDVPFTFEASVDDNQVYKLPATSGEEIIDALIADLEACKDYPQKSYASNYVYNSARITRNAVYSILADLYLWRASDANIPASVQKYNYQKCVECCDYVLNAKYDEYNANKHTDYSTWDKNTDFDSYILTNYGYPLLAEETTPGENNDGPLATKSIFCRGNSFESIFELTYMSGTQNLKNTDVAEMYGNAGGSGDNGTPFVSASDILIPEPLTTANNTYNDKETFPCFTDYRSITSFRYDEDGANDILKYTTSSCYAGASKEYGIITTSGWTPIDEAYVSLRTKDNSIESWILYRLTDVMLMRAEAEVCLAGLIDKSAESLEYTLPATRVNGQDLFDNDSLLYNDAFNLVMSVYMRSNPMSQTSLVTARPDRSKYTTYEAFLDLVENERHREFLFEGKRFFDLVRRSRREGSTAHLAQAISSKFGEASRAVLIKMSMLDFMYMPYLKDQMKLNPYLIQNPAYNEDDDYIKN